MAAEVRSLQFFLEESREEESVLNALSAALGFAVDSSDAPMESAVGVLQLDSYAQGFRTGCLVSWPGSVGNDVDPVRVAHELATRLQTNVLLEVPETEPLWLLTSNQGTQQMVGVHLLEDGIDVESDKLQ